MAKNQNKETKPKIRAGKQKGITAGFSYEYVIDLEDINARISQFNIMRRSDSQVGGILRAIKLPIRRAEWSIKNGKEEVRSFIEDNLFNKMSTSFNDFIRWILTSLDFGFSAFEKVFDFDDTTKKIYWRKLLFLPQKTIYKIEAEEDGGLKQILQYPAEPEEMVSDNGYIIIPVEYSLVFTLEREGDWYGTSILRNAYGNWKVKDSLIKIDAIKHDRYGVGVPYMKLSPNYNDDDVALARDTLKKMRSHEYSYMIIPPNVEDFGILELSGNGNIDTVGSIRYHDESIAKSVLAQFIDLGTTKSGNRALGQSFIQLFLMSLNSVADFIAETFSKYAIKQLVEYNFGEQEEYPELTHSKIDIFDIIESLKVLNDLYKNGVISLSPEDENIIRQYVGLPPKVESQEQEEINKKQSENDNETKYFDEHEHRLEFDENGNPVTFRELAPIEKTINWREYSETIDRIETNFIEDIKKYRDKQIKSLVYDLVNLEKPIDKIKLRYGDMYKKIIQDYQEKAFKIGFEQAKKEKEKAFLEKGYETINLYEFKNIPNDVLEVMGINAQIGAEVLSNRTKAYIVNMFVQYKNEGLPNKDIANRLYANTLGKGDKIIKEEFDRVSNMWGQGRKQYGLDDNEVKGAYYSAVMDGKACDVCVSTDNQYNAYHEKPFSIDYLQQVAPAPNPDCRGGAACRCIWVYEYFVERGEGVEGFPKGYPNSLKKKEPKDVSLIDRINGARSVKDLEFALQEHGVTNAIDFVGIDFENAKNMAKALYELKNAHKIKNLVYLGSDGNFGKMRDNLKKLGIAESKIIEIRQNAEIYFKYENVLAVLMHKKIEGKKFAFIGINRRYFMNRDGKYYIKTKLNGEVISKVERGVNTGIGTITHEYVHGIDWENQFNYSKNFKDDLDKALAKTTKNKNEWTNQEWNTYSQNIEKLNEIMKKLGKAFWISNEKEELAYLTESYLTGKIVEEKVGEDVYSVLKKYSKEMGLEKIKDKIYQYNLDELKSYGWTKEKYEKYIKELEENENASNIAMLIL